METLAYLHLALACEAPPETTPTPSLESVKFFEWLKRQKLATHARIYLLSVVAVLSILGMAGEALAQRVLRLGTSDPHVTFIQQRLRQLGYFNQSPSRLFDSATRNAVIRFQQDNGLQPDGIVGPRTESALFAEFAQTRPISTEEYSYDPLSSGYDSSGYDSSTYSVLRLGDRSPDVRLLQERLSAENFYLGPINGVFGYETDSAVRQFQRERGLLVDGIVGQDTWAALEADNRPVARRPPQRREFALRPGNSGPQVEELQEKLQAIGLYRGSIDGYYGFGTTQAVRRLQQENNLAVTGIANRDTLAALTTYQYTVIVPNQDSDTLRQVRRAVFDAFIADSKLGNYVNAGIFNNRARAESRSQLLRSRGLDARVAHSP
jgi:peptidoglycan hydrolase-like protein with peptidoglycan-binding domain